MKAETAAKIFIVDGLLAVGAAFLRNQLNIPSI
jgi:hypothetical protein